MKRIKIYDTTLRDGAQTQGINFSVEDKLKIAKILDYLSVDYIEGGFPFSNPKDKKFFKEIKNYNLQAKVVAFGSTKKPDLQVDSDANLLALLAADTQTVTIVGKTWDLHVKKALKTTLAKNLEIIKESIDFLKKHKKEVIFDAEHFFDGYKNNREYTISCIKEAESAGADVIVLCDTNGGTLPQEVAKIIKEIKSEVKTAELGIHAHNDIDLAVANTIVAVLEGCSHVQGTINGYGERCGNANLCSIIPNLKLKLGIDCISDEKLKLLTEVSRYVAEVANLAPPAHAPYVGYAAFSHKGGVHIDGVCKEPITYEHINPEVVGNQRRLLISELSGRAGILHKLKDRLSLKKQDELIKKILDKVKGLEADGFAFEDADASFELLVKKLTGEYQPVFKLKGFRVIVEKTQDNKLISEATVKIEVDNKKVYTVAEGEGPVHALDNALRKALEEFYPKLKEVHLTDYKVRVLDAASGTAAKVRVLIESADKDKSWSTVGVSENIIEASWQALVDSIDYTLLHKND
jgi:2-isopropylmalate synthase